MKGKYSQTDLEHKGDSVDEHNRLRCIFDDLIVLGKKGQELSMIEQDFVFHGITFFNENPNNFPFVNDARFCFHYLTYSRDLTGGRKYFKTRDGQKIEVPLLEKENDLQYLMDEADGWRKELDSKKSYSDELKQQAMSEFREDLKKLKLYHNIANNPQLAGSFYYRYKETGLILRSKANYIFGKRYLEGTNTSDLSFVFCGETIEFTPASMIHILNRHFAEQTKQYPSGKDYHIEDIAPWLMPIKLKEIITAIDDLKVFQKQKRTEINLLYLGERYQFWAEPDIKFIKDHKGPIDYKRIKSFYRATDPAIILKLKNNFKLVPITNELSVYVPIQNTP